MSDAVIKELRRLQGMGLITPAHCVRAERYIRRHSAIFCDAPRLTVSHAASLAVGYTAIAIQLSSPAVLAGTAWTHSPPLRTMRPCVCSLTSSGWTMFSATS